MWACQYFRYTEPRQFLSSGGLGTMGFGLPAAIGAQIGRPDKQVIDIAGDGSFQMNIQELGTAMAYEVPIMVAILNNGYLGMVRQWQELFWNKRYSHTYFETQPDFVKIARGLRGLRRHGDREGPGRRRAAPRRSRTHGRPSSTSTCVRRRTSTRWCPRAPRSWR